MSKLLGCILGLVVPVILAAIASSLIVLSIVMISWLLRTFDVSGWGWLRIFLLSCLALVVGSIGIQIARKLPLLWRTAAVLGGISSSYSLAIITPFSEKWQDALANHQFCGLGLLMWLGLLKFLVTLGAWPGEESKPEESQTT